MAAASSTGTATVVLGDVAGSTRRWQQPGSESQASRRLAALLGELTAAHADAVDRVLRAAGIGYAATSPGNRPVSGWDALTPAELGVVVAVDP